MSSAPAPASAPASAPAPGADLPDALHWRCGRSLLSLERVRIMGVLNVTPDSFSDGGRYAALDAALAQARAMIDQGADIIDVGGESTRPGAAPVPPQAELARVLPVLRELRGCGVPLSVDTSQPALMRAALELDVAIINDVRALRLPGALDALRGADCGVVLMHLQGDPATMQLDPRYGDVVADVAAWLQRRLGEVCAAGIAPGRVALDPGFGFGKNHAHNLALLAGLGRLAALGRPLLVGLSRKASLGQLTGRPVTERAAASVAAALLAVERGARIVRVHDVAATRDALAVWEGVRRAGAAAAAGEGA
jgi:dihydropteroate synthase